MMRDYNRPIEDSDDLDDLKGIGQNIMDHIKEFLDTGKVY